VEEVRREVDHETITGPFGAAILLPAVELREHVVDRSVDDERIGEVVAPGGMVSHEFHPAYLLVPGPQRQRKGTDPRFELREPGCDVGLGRSEDRHALPGFEPITDVYDDQVRPLTSEGGRPCDCRSAT
jgi:hypothetical protein